MVLGLLFLLLTGLFCLTAFQQGYRKVFDKGSKKKKGILLTPHFFYTHLQRPDSVRFFTLATLNILRFFFGLAAFLILLPYRHEPLSAVAALIFLITLFLFPGELIPRTLANRKPALAMNGFSIPAAVTMTLCLPLTYPLFFFSRFFAKNAPSPKLSESELKVKQELVDIIQEAETGAHLAVADKDLIESVVSFPSRIAREVMIPRVDIFALPARTPIREAAEKCIEEGYSRVPVYKNSVDEIIGILMYKDLLIKYMEFSINPGKPEILETPIDTIVKKTLYTPETKKISHLLQEFRKKQQHMAIVVDEYGGTEGIVTIEDILEEIVGDIADEYDEDQELYVALASGCWIIDARMSILDIEEELGINIPQEGEYDTIGGYIYYRTGTIPPKGFVIDHDDFRIDIVKSGERGVEKIRLTPKTEASHES